MPIRSYEPHPSPCRLCGAGFDLVQATTEPLLTECPRCGGPVRSKGAVALHSPRVLKPLSISEARSSGFSVFKRTGHGEFEKQ